MGHFLSPTIRPRWRPSEETVKNAFQTTLLLLFDGYPFHLPQLLMDSRMGPAVPLDGEAPTGRTSISPDRGATTPNENSFCV